MRLSYIILLALNAFFCFSQEVNDTIAVTFKTEDSTIIKLTRLKLNSLKSDFSPFLVGNNLVFVSGREKDLGVQYVDVNGESEITDLYQAQQTDSINFRKSLSFDPLINSKYYEGPFCFNKKGDVIYFTGNDKRSATLKIFFSKKENGIWQKPAVLPFCKDEFLYCHPALSPKEDVLVFASNRNYSNSKMDLYMSEYTNGIWSPPILMDKKINDSSNQVFPFINKNNVLYFSSSAPKGFGGLDLYHVDLNSDTSQVKHLPQPYNSTSDDFGVWIDSASSSGYLSSNRNKNTGDDIYYFSKNIPDFSNWKKITSKNSFCFNFFEENTLASSDTLNLTYEWNFGDGQKGRGLKTRHCFAGAGEYLIQLNIIDKVSGEVFMNETSSTLVIEKPDQLLIECTDTINAGENIILSTKKCYLKGYELNQMYWSFGDGRYNTGKTVKHTYVTPGTYKVEMGLLGKNLESNKTEQFKVEKNIIVMNKK